jgi:uncharacterized protein YndB with AHSA1/START domain
MTTNTTNTIEKHVDLNAPMPRVWRAITDSKEFGTWFQVKFEAPFVAGKAIKGTFTVPNYEHIVGEFFVDRIDPRDGVFAFRWHPGAIDPSVDYSKEPLTTVTFALSETPTGTHLHITETGFDSIPAERRAKAFAMNDAGWTFQAKQIADYLARVS